MTKDQIKVGGFYLTKVNGNLVTVRVDSIDGGPGRHLGYDYGGKSKGYAYATRYRVTNMKTGRTMVFKSATKFRKEMPAVPMRGTEAYNALKPSTTDRVANGHYLCTKCSFMTVYTNEMAEHERRLNGHNMKFLEKSVVEIPRINVKQALGRIDLRGGPITGVNRGGPPPQDENR